MKVFGLYRSNSREIEMIASSSGSANTMRAMFGPAWKSRQLTEAEAASPWVQAEITLMQEAGAWS